MPSEIGKCGNCALADFKTPLQNGMKGFANCRAVKEKWRYLPRQTECENGKFQTASAEVMAVRRKVLGDGE